MANWPLKTLDGVMMLDTTARTVVCAGQGGSLDGVTATVDTAGALNSRITASRILLTGVFALAWRKKKDDRELYIMVDGPAYSMVARVDPKRGADARKFAAGINTSARGGAVAGAALGTDAARQAVMNANMAKRIERKKAGKFPLIPSDWAKIIVAIVVIVIVVLLIVNGQSA